MHRLSTSFVLGYHGCDAAVAEDVLKGTPFRQSENSYDWLGPGIYFWEANPQRGLDFAIETSRRAKSAIKTPAVVGAVIDLGLCLDMTTLNSIELVKIAHESLVLGTNTTDKPLPENSEDMMRRYLDCAVINRLHTMLAEQSVAIDTVKGIFIERDPIYAGSGFHEKTHIQIAVCNPACIKGVFRIPESQLVRWQP